MTAPVTPRSADFTTRLLRKIIPLYFGSFRWSRKPPKAPGAVTEFSYGPHADERLEFIEAQAGVPQRTPIVYVHGGGWILGTKESYSPYLSFLAHTGHPVINVEYPLAPENPHPGILRSLFRALDWIRREHPEFSEIHVMGDSAGGNLAMMVGLLAANPKLLGDVDPDRSESPLPCRSVISLYGVLDRLTWIEDGFPGGENMLECYGGKAAFEATVPPELAITPTDLVFENAPPSLLACGTADPLRRSSQLFAERLAAGPGKVVHKEYEGEAHGFFNFGKTKSDAQLREDILGFLAGVEPESA